MMRLRIPGRRQRRERWTAGSAGVEFALTAPLLLALAVGLSDYATLAGQSGALVAATRAGAEYARAYPTDTTGGADGAVTRFMSFSPGVAPSATTFCTCTDGTSVSCPLPAQPSPQSNPCSAKTDPRVLQYVAVTAQQATTYFAFPGFSFPTAISAASYLRWQ
jgi:Flp pilus assembly protein TadG